MDVYVEGWKGKDSPQIKSLQEDFVIIEHRKSKESKEVIESRTLVKKEAVTELWNIIKTCPLHEKVGYRYLVRKVVAHYKLAEKEKLSEEQMMETFNGGKYRSKYYFPLFYYPLKVLEQTKWILYHGRGGITRMEV